MSNEYKDWLRENIIEAEMMAIDWANKNKKDTDSEVINVGFANKAMYLFWTPNGWKVRWFDVKFMPYCYKEGTNKEIV